MPQGYFDEDAAAALTRLRARAIADRAQQFFADFPAVHASCDSEKSLGVRRRSDFTGIGCATYPSRRE